MLFVCILFVLFGLAVLDLLYDDGLIHTIGHKVWPLQWNRRVGIRGSFEHDGWILAEDVDLSKYYLAHHEDEVVL